jgi:hypothetical protein
MLYKQNILSNKMHCKLEPCKTHLCAFFFHVMPFLTTPCDPFASETRKNNETYQEDAEIILKG